jgi:protein TonB
MAANLISKVYPIIPKIILGEVRGAVILHAVISPQGKVTSLTVISGPELLRKAVTDAVWQWKYKPYLVQGKPVEVETSIMINIDLAGN